MKTLYLRTHLTSHTDNVKQVIVLVFTPLQTPLQGITVPFVIHNN